jgi:hypothetical protein
MLTAPETRPTRLVILRSLLMINSVNAGIYGTDVVSRISTTSKVI